MTYNGLDTRVGMTDSTGSRTFRRAGIGVTSPVLSDGSANYTPSGEWRGGVKTAYSGGLKSFDTQTNSAQAVVGQRLTDAFGNQISSSGVWKGRFAYGGPHGYQEDPDTGLRLLGHRYYDSSTGRFLTRDPIKDGRNWYVYCGNDPINSADPTGLSELTTANTRNQLALYADDVLGSMDPGDFEAAMALLKKVLSQMGIRLTEHGMKRLLERVKNIGELLYALQNGEIYIDENGNIYALNRRDGIMVVRDRDGNIKTILNFKDKTEMDKEVAKIKKAGAKRTKKKLSDVLKEMKDWFPWTNGR